MVLADLHIFHSRPIAPTRRVALGEVWLPTDPSPGFGGLLLATVVGKFAHSVQDGESLEQIMALVDDLEHDRPIPQPRLRHRFQTDTDGLVESTFALVGEGSVLTLEFLIRGTSEQQLLGALYAANSVPTASKPAVFRLIKRALHLPAMADDLLLSLLAQNIDLEGNWLVGSDEVLWACEVLGFAEPSLVTKEQVTRRFREMARNVHPDGKGNSKEASTKMADLTRAKSILLTSG